MVKIASLNFLRRVIRKGWSEMRCSFFLFMGILVLEERPFLLPPLCSGSRTLILGRVGTFQKFDGLCSWMGPKCTSGFINVGLVICWGEQRGPRNVYDSLKKSMLFTKKSEQVLIEVLKHAFTSGTRSCKIFLHRYHHFVLNPRALPT